MTVNSEVDIGNTVKQGVSAAAARTADGYRAYAETEMPDADESIALLNDKKNIKAEILIHIILTLLMTRFISYTWIMCLKAAAIWSWSSESTAGCRFPRLKDLFFTVFGKTREAL
ncbi:MAG: hypothetical protein ACLR56_00175 [Oscillospiraceae bacterium]